MVYAGFVPLSAWAIVRMDASSGRCTDPGAHDRERAASFVFLANRLYSSALTNFYARAEKDALFVELEQAKANSDVRAPAGRGSQPGEIPLPRHHEP